MIFTDLLLETWHVGFFFLTTGYSFLAILPIFHCCILIAATMQTLLAVAMACDWQITRLRGDVDSYDTPVPSPQLTPKAEDGKPTT